MDAIAPARGRPSQTVFAQFLQPVFDSSLDTARQEQRLRDLLDGLLHVVRGVAIPSCKKKVGRFNILGRELEVRLDALLNAHRACARAAPPPLVASRSRASPRRTRCACTG